MTPSTWLTIVAFFLFVAPGLLFDLMSARKRVQRRESTFTEVSRVALVSTGCSSFAFLVLAAFGALCDLLHWNVLPDPSAMIRQGSTYVADEFARVLVSGIVVVLLSLAASRIAFWWIYRNHETGIAYTSSWQLVMRDGVPNGAAVHVRAKLTDGTLWFGQVADYSPDPEVADRELVLCPPMLTKPKGGNHAPVPAKWHRVILRGSEIVSLSVTYGPSSPQPTP